jgi:hypothetical protein
MEITACPTYREHRKNRRPLLIPFLLTVYSVQGTPWTRHFGITLGLNRVCHFVVVSSPLTENGNASPDPGIQSAKSFGENDVVDEDVDISDSVDAEEAAGGDPCAPVKD